MPSGAGTEDLVREVIAGLRDAADNGEPAAITDLSRRSGSRVAAPVAPAPVAPSLTIPDRYVTRPNGEKYYVRKIGQHDDVMFVRRARVKKIPILFVGEPGTGKTALVEAALASDPEDPGTMYTVQGTGDTIVDDFVGGHWQDDAGLYHWADGPLVLAAIYGRPLYIDEIALIDPKVMAVVYSLMDGRNELRITQTSKREGGNVITAIQGFYVVAATNPNAPGARMGEALLSRFKVQPEVTTDMKLARDMGVDSKLITAVNNLQRKREENIISWVPQMREMLTFKEVAEEFGKDVALRNLIGTAPEQDRAEVKSIISRQFANRYSTLTVD
jgi:nitric oxide reductase NorQ protein